MMPFAHMRVVELGSGVALAFAGKMFADFGAEVVKVEPSGGDGTLRTMPPLVDAGGGHMESAYAAWLNTNKRSVTGDAESPDDHARLAGLVAGADVLLDARPPGVLAGSGLGHAALRAANPGLVVCAISWFGEDGPYRDFAATEAVCRAMAAGVHPVGPAEGPPMIPIGGQSGVIAGLATFIAAAAGLYGRLGRRFSVSVQEVLMHAMEMDFSSAIATGADRRRPGLNEFGRHYPSSIYRTADGWIGISTVTPAQWLGFCAMIERPDLAADPRYATSEGRTEAGLVLERIVVPLLASRPSLHWFEAGLKHRLALAIVPSMEELLAQHVHRGRGAFVPVRIGDAAFEAPVLPQRLGEAGPHPGGTAPLPGADEGATFAARAPAGPVQASGPGAGLPLAGVRIVDLTMGWAGPLATRLLGDLGAEVVKVESCVYPDWWRGSDRGARFFAERLYERNNNFNMMNRNKLGITLDLTTSEGVGALRELIAGAHGLMENYAADVLPKLGLGYELFRRARPDLVMVSMSAYGAGNAWSGMRAYGGTLEQASGLPAVSGQADWPPAMSAYAYGDPVSGFNGAAAMLIGLIGQQQGAGGRHVNLSQIEGMLGLAAPKVIEQSIAGRVGPRIGNRHPVHVPHGCFRCAGADEWLVVAITGAADWQALCGVIGRPDLRGDPALRTPEGRRRHEDAIEAAVSAWTAGLPAREAMRQLQACGVPAGAALTATDLLDDPHLAHRAFWQRRERPFVGSCLMLSAPFREAAGPYAIRRASPTLGQDNANVFRALLNWSDARIATLSAQGIIGTEARSDRDPNRRSSAPADSSIRSIQTGVGSV